MPDKGRPVDLIFSVAEHVTMEDAHRTLEAAAIGSITPLGELGIILGKGTLAQLEALRDRPEFSAVDRDQPVSIPPPDDPVQ